MARRASSPKLKVVTTKGQPSSTLPQPPAHLGPDGLELWRGIQAEYEIADSGGLQLLRQAAECADRIASVRKQLNDEGEVLIIRGTPRAHPAAAIERDARAALVRCLRNLNLDIEPLRDRPGRPGGSRF